MNNFSIELAQQLVNSTEQFPVAFDIAWSWLGYSRKDNAKRFLVDNFTDDIDFLITEEPTTTGIQAKPKQLILLTIECLKMWGMMCGTAQGKQIRLYFLECEKIAKQAQQPPKLPQTYLEALKELVAKEEENERLKLQAAEDAPKVEFAQAVTNAENTITMNEYAKAIGTGRTRLFRKLRELNIVMKKPSTMPYQKYIEKGYFKVCEEITKSGVKPYAVITGSGQVWLHQQLGLPGKPYGLPLWGN